MTGLLPYLYDCSNLVDLRLADDHLGDTFVRDLSLDRFSPSLKRLDLSRNQFFDILVLEAALSRSRSTLKRLDLSESIRNGNTATLKTPSHLLVVTSRTTASEAHKHHSLLSTR